MLNHIHDYPIANGVRRTHDATSVGRHLSSRKLPLLTRSRSYSKGSLSVCCQPSTPVFASPDRVSNTDPSTVRTSYVVRIRRHPRLAGSNNAMLGKSRWQTVTTPSCDRWTINLPVCYSVVSYISDTFSCNASASPRACSISTQLGWTSSTADFAFKPINVGSGR